MRVLIATVEDKIIGVFENAQIAHASIKLTYSRTTLVTERIFDAEGPNELHILVFSDNGVYTTVVLKSHDVLTRVDHL